VIMDLPRTVIAFVNFLFMLGHPIRVPKKEDPVASNGELSS
jgi:hypothetical protein